MCDPHVGRFQSTRGSSQGNDMIVYSKYGTTERHRLLREANIRCEKQSRLAPVHFSVL